MSTALAWRNILHARTRTAVALASVCFAIVLLFMQLGFYASCRDSATRVQEMLEFDLMLTSPLYLFLRESGDFPRERLYQVRASEVVADATAISVGVASWRNADTGNLQEVLLLGVDPAERPFVSRAINDALPGLTRPDSAVMDRVAHALMGPHAPGLAIEIGGRRLAIVDDYAWGVGFNALASMIVSDRTLSALRGRPAASRLELAAIRVAPGVDPREAARALAATLPDDVTVWTRAELLEHERAYWLKVKPIGLMFTSGVVLAFLVGTVILYQVLVADVTNHLREYATLKAMGYEGRRIRGIVIRQGFLFGVLGFVPAAMLSTALYAIVRETAKLPLSMTPGRLVTVLGLGVAMCAASAALAVRRVTAADPADLF